MHPQISIDSIHPLSRAQYDAMIGHGLLEDEKVELIHGFLVEMTPIGAPHNSVVAKLTELLVLALQGRASIRPQSSFAASDNSEPEPDVAVVPPGRYHIDHPSQAHLIVEVFETSLDRDRTVKAELYAECGVPEYWVVNLIDQVIEVHTDIADNRYTAVDVKSRGDSIGLREFPDVALAVDDLLPPP